MSSAAAAPATKKKALDSRVPALIRNGVDSRQRSFIIMVGDKSRNQIPNLHYLMMQSNLKMNKNVIWAYKKKLLGFTSNRLNREKKIRNDVKRGTREANEIDPFEAFLSNQNIRYVYYKESEKVLGQTCGMLVLQDFEGLTPNLMAKTIETVEGGGLVIMLLKSMSSLKQLYTMTMDVHSRYRTEAHSDVVARFNERFLLSLSDCKNCLVVDDELNVLPISGARHVKRLPPKDDDEVSPEEQELKDLKESLVDTQPAGSLVSLAKTINQAESILRFIDAIAEKTFNSTVSLTAGRGRGKSAALGIAISAAIAQDYSNIFVTSPTPENLKTLFEFILKGFDAMGYNDKVDYDIIQSTNPSFNKAIVRIDVKRLGHRQTIQYIAPTDSHVLGQAELVIIDEAAAIPLPVVKKLLGPYLVFMASTINGYEGTGRSLSLKLIQQLRDQSQTGDSGRSLIEVTLTEPIRYSPGDPVESWLNKLLCLDAKVPKNSKYSSRGTPHPNECSLYYINRDTLFSYDPISESFLQRMMALFVSSHYKNSPNDLQLMSDAPAHQLFALFGPDVGKDASIPTPLCVIQLALEGEISKAAIKSSLSKGIRGGGDLIPWLVSQQFQDDDFASLSGARIVRIATHPDYQKMGYGSRALELLTDYFNGKFASIDDNLNTLDEGSYSIKKINDDDLDHNLKNEKIKPRNDESLPPLFINLSHKSPNYLHYMGVSYGLTNQLHKFWKRQGYTPVYLRQTSNDLTGEHTCVMIKTLENRDNQWLKSFAKDFYKRFLNLLSYNFKNFGSIQSLSILESTKNSIDEETENQKTFSKDELDENLTPFDLRRLESYANSLLDYHVIIDMLPYISSLYFQGKIAKEVALSHVQSAILLAVGLQRKDVDEVSRELKIESNQGMAMFSKVIRKVSQYFSSLVKESMEKDLPALEEDQLIKEMNGEEIVVNDVEEMERELEDELNEAGDEVLDELKKRQKELISNLDLTKYKINDVAGWDSNKEEISKAIKKGSTIALKKGLKRTTESSEKIYQEEMGKLKKPKKTKKNNKH